MGTLNISAATMENSREVPQKMELELLYDPMIALLDIYQEKIENSNLKTHKHPNVHGSIIITKTWK